MTTVVLVFPALFARRRWKTSWGAFLFLYTFVFLLQVGLGEFEQWPMVAVGIIVGLVVDVSIRRDLPAWELGALIPIAAWSAYFLMFELQTGVGWSPELWAGITLMSGLIGGLLGSLTTEVNQSRSPIRVSLTAPAVVACATRTESDLVACRGSEPALQAG